MSESVAQGYVAKNIDNKRKLAEVFQGETSNRSVDLTANVSSVSSAPPTNMAICNNFSINITSNKKGQSILYKNCNHFFCSLYLKYVMQ